MWQHTRASCLMLFDYYGFPPISIFGTPGEVPRIHYGKRCSTNFFFTKFSKKPAASSQRLDQTLPWDHSPETCAERESHGITYADSSIWRDENFCIQEWIPSGKHLLNNGKSPFFMGKSTKKLPFSIAMLVHQRVQKGIPGYPKVPLLLLRYPWS